jgi:hypothetical protein
MKYIIITVKKNGDQSIRGEDLVGNECDALMKPFEQAAGGVTARQDLPEYHLPTTTEAQQKIGT